MTTPQSAAAGAGLDLVCVSYLAAAQVLTVPDYPSANTGSAVVDRISSLAGDGPLVACIATIHAVRTGLICNPVGAGRDGADVVGCLDAWGVTHHVSRLQGVSTPHLTVIADSSGDRTWFAHLDTAPNRLLHADLGLLRGAAAVYIDGYSLIAPAAAQALRALGGSDALVLLNLGGDAPNPALVDAAAARPPAVVQSSVRRPDRDDAVRLAGEIAEQFPTPVVIVTCGRAGAVARLRDGRLIHLEAEPVPMSNTHGAGAAFSAGYIASILTFGNDHELALRSGITTATAHIACGGLPTSHRPAPSAVTRRWS